MYECPYDSRFTELDIKGIAFEMYLENSSVFEFDPDKAEKSNSKFGNSWTDIKIEFMNHVKKCDLCNDLYERSNPMNEIDRSMQEEVLKQAKEILSDFKKDYQEYVKYFIEKYNKKVVPLIEKKEYKNAASQLEDILYNANDIYKELPNSNPSKKHLYGLTVILNKFIRLFHQKKQPNLGLIKRYKTVLEDKLTFIEMLTK